MNDKLRCLTERLFDLPDDLKWIEEDLFGFDDLLKVELSRVITATTSDTQIVSTGSVIINSVISPSASIGHFSLIRNSIIKDGVRIGAHVEIANSVILNDAVIPHHNYIGWSLVGRDVRMGGNARTAVRRLDGKNPRIELPDIGIVYSSGQKVGAFIGDKTKIGSSVVLNPLTVVGKNSAIEPGIVLSGYYHENSIVRNRNILRSNHRR